MAFNATGDEDYLLNHTITENKYLSHSEVSDIVKNKDAQDISMIYYNTSSLPKHFDELKHSLRRMNFKPDLICLTETKITTTVNTYFQPEMDDYEYIQAKSNNDAGSVGLFFHDSLDITRRYDLDITVPGLFETLWVNVARVGSKKKCVVGVVYRHPGVTELPFFEKRLEKTMKMLTKEKQKFYIVGDVNADVFRWEEFYNISSFIDMMASNSAINLINKPTRFPRGKQPGSPALLDHFYTNQIDSVSKINLVVDDISDHMPILAILQVNVKRMRPKADIYVRDYKRLNKENFINLIKEFNHDSANSIDNQFEQLHAHILNCINRHTPMRKLSKKEIKFMDKPWISNSLQNSIDYRYHLFKLSRRNIPNQQQIKKHYNKYKKTLEKALYAAKTLYFRNKFTEYKNDTKAIWRTINKITSRKNSKKNVLKNLKLENCTITDDSNQMANALNSFFIQVGPILASKQTPSINSFQSYLHNNPSNPNSFFLSPTCREEILDILQTFSPSNCEDPDKIPPRLYKLGAPALSPILSEMINKCFSEGYFPRCLKIGKVIPIFKEGDKTERGNYRPITITSGTSKLIEKIVKKRLTNFLEKHNILTNVQFGYRSSHSTSHAILNISEKIMKNLDLKNKTVSVFLDLSKGFDCVNHNILLSKLRHYGIRGLAFEFFRSYLTDRKQFTVVNGVSSSVLTVLCGVPQGSVLGPLLFLLYTNDLAKSTNFSVCLFADDTCLSYSHKNLETLQTICNEELAIVDDWFRANKLTANSKKASKFLLSKQIRGSENINDPLFELKMGNVTLERVSTMKYLGVILDEKMTWNNHINYLCTKLSQKAGIFSKLRYYLDLDRLVNVYYALFNSHLQYAMLCWGATTSTNIDRLQIIQNRVIRNMTKSPHFFRLDNHYLNLRILKVQELHKLEVLKFMHSHFNRNLPDYFRTFFELITHAHRTRGIEHGNYVIENCRTSLGQRSIKFIGPKLWNDTTPDCRQLNKLKFKKHVKTTILANY